LDSPFVGKKWDPGISTFYDNEVLTLSANGLGSGKSSYIWKILNAEDELIYSYSSSSAEVKIDNPGLSGLYNVELVVLDEYGNKGSFSNVVEILSSDAPVAESKAIFKTEEITGLTEIYEFESITLDAEGSKASKSDVAGVTIKKVIWSVFKNGNEFKEIERTNFLPFEFELAEAGTYDIKLIIENSVGLKASGENLVVSVKPNYPVVGNVAYDDFFEGVEGNISISGLSSENSVKGDIVEVLLEVEGMDPITLDDPSNILWTPEYNSKSTADLNLYARITVTNEAGRKFSTDDFILKVKDNNPSPLLKLSSEALVYDNSVISDVQGSVSPDGTLLDLKLTITDNGGTVVAEHDFLAENDTSFSYLFSGEGSVGFYKAALSASNINGAIVVEKAIEVTDKQAVAVFSMNPDPDVSQLFEGEEIVLDATGSYGADGNPIPGDNYTWVVRLNGEILDSPVKGASDGLYSYTFKEDNFGNYSFELSVDDSAGKTDTYSKQFFVSINKPVDLKVTKNGLSTPGNQILKGVATAPDGNYDDLVFNWYFEKTPGEGVTPNVSNVPSATCHFIDGENHIIYLEVINGYGFSAVTEYVLLADDLTPPEVPVVTNNYIDNETCDTTPSWMWSSSADAVEYRYAVDSEPADETGWTYTIATSGEVSEVLDAGDHVLYVQARDNAMPPNWSSSSSSESCSVSIDLIPPVAPNVSAGIRTKNRKPEWTWSISDSTSYGFRYQMNATEAGAWTSQDLSDLNFQPESDLTDGEYELFVQVRDKAGNWSASGSSLFTIDNIAPEITLVGDLIYKVNVNTVYTDPGATAFDISMDSNVDVIVGGDTVDTSVINSDYEISYFAEDDLGNSTVIYRSVQVRDIDNPVISLTGDNPMFIYMGNTYVDPGFSAVDSFDGDITSQVSSSFVDDPSSVDVNTAGNYQVVYSVKDSSNNSATVTRTVYVLPGIVPVTSDLDVELGESSSNLNITWDNLQGVSEYQVYSSTTIDGSYQLAQTTDMLFYSETNDSVVKFYKVIGKLGGYYGKLEDASIVKLAKIAGPVANFQVSKLQTELYVDLSWDAIPGIEGYKIYASAWDVAGTYTEIADVTSNSYHYETNVPIGPIDFKVVPYMTRQSKGWNTSDFIIESSIVAGHRGVTNDEWISEVMKEIYDCTKVLKWSATPWADYWNAKDADKAKINGGFEVDPSGIPDNIPGSRDSALAVYIAQYDSASGNTLIWNTVNHSPETPEQTITAFKAGRVGTEIVRSREWGEVANNDGDYVFTRWWFDNCSARYLTLLGHKRYHDDWYENNTRIYGVITIAGIYPGEIKFNWMDTDDSHTQDAGAGIDGGTFVIKRNGGTEVNVGFDSSKHFSW
jgi:hypothetical protein